jgi:hypothetical protein
MNAEYLGDSVYARHSDNDMIVLTTENGDGSSNTVYLEYGVWDALLRFAKRIGWKLEGNA